MDQSLSRRTALKAFGIGGITLTGCLGRIGGDGGSAPDALGAPEMVFHFDPTQGQLPENVAVDRDGNKYVSISPRGEIWRFSADNELDEEPYATFTVSGDFLVGPAGVEVDPSGVLYVCFASELDNPAVGAPDAPEPDTNGVWRVPKSGEPRLYAEISSETGPTFPNDILLHDDSLLVTDSLGGRIWRAWPDGTTEEWVSGPRFEGTSAEFPVGTDGITTTADGTVYTSNLEKGLLVRVPVAEDGSAGSPETFVEDERLVGADGLACDVQDNIYVAVQGHDAIRRVSPDGEIETLAANGMGDFDGFDSPSDVTFGTTAEERRSVFITNLAFSEAPDPSFMRLDVGVEGRPIEW